MSLLQQERSRGESQPRGGHTLQTAAGPRGGIQARDKLQARSASAPLNLHHLPILLLLLFLLLLPALNLPAKDMAFTGMLRSYGGGRFTHADLPVVEQTVDLSLEGWGENSAVLINPYAYLLPGADPELGVREAYIDFYLPMMDLRLGKQAIVWGQAEGAFITDIVSPQNLRSFILADFREIRMGVPAAKADLYAGPVTLEAVWLPRFVPTESPAADSIWAKSPDFSWAAPATVTIADTRLPGDSLESSEIFGKASYFGSAVNAEVMAGYAWDDLPVMELDKSGAVPPTPEIIATPVYKRYTVLGGSFSTTLLSTVLRAEGAVYLDRSFNTSDPAIGDGIEEHHQIHALAGLDRTILGLDISLQYIFQYVDGWNDYMLTTDEFSHTATFRIRESLLSDTLTLQLFAYFGIDAEDPLSAHTLDMLLRPSVSWSMEDGVELTAGADIFLGPDGGTFGSYEENSLAYLSFRWYF